MEKFEASMAQLDAMIHKLETNLGQKHSVSPFDALRTKFGGAPAAAPNKEEAKQPEAKAEAPAQQPKAKKEKKEKAPKAAAAPKDVGPALPAELEWFNACDIRVAEIVEATTHECSDKLYFEKIDVAEGSLRDIGSGLRQFVPQENMKGLCLVFANLKPRKLAHIMSQGMVMCASNADHTAIEVMRPPAGAKVGERVYLEGNPIPNFSQEMQAELKPKKKYMENFLTVFKTNENGEASFNGIRCLTSAGAPTSQSLKNSTIS